MIYIAFLLLGLGSGAAYALLGVSLVITYRSSRLVNFATGAVAMYAGYSFATLENQGAFFNPIIGLPALVHVGQWPTIVNIVVALCSTAVVGLLAYLIVFRPLRRALPLARVMASVAVMLLLQSLVAVQLGTNEVGVAAYLPAKNLTIGKVSVNEEGPILVGIACLLTVGLWLLSRYTRFGLQTRAVSDSQRGALLNGLPAEKIEVANWLLATVFAGLSGILLAPITSLTTDGYSLLVIPALAVALLGRLSSFIPVLIGGVLLGMLQSESVYLVGKATWLPPNGLETAIPLVMILLYLAFRGQSVTQRGEIIRRMLPRAPEPRFVGRGTAILVVGGAAGLLLLHGGYRYALVTSLLLAMLGLSTVLLTGYLGQISLAQLVFAGLGAFLMHPLAYSLGLPFPAAPLLAALIVAAGGILVGFPAVRVRGVNLAITTLALGVAVENIYFESPQYTGGFAGSTVPALSIFGNSLAGNAVGFGLITLVCLALVGVGIAVLRRSAVGAWLLAIRANERAAATAGVHVARAKIATFGLSAFVAGLMGALWAYRDGTVQPGSFDIFLSLTAFMILFLTGISSIGGGLLSGILGSGGIVYLVLFRQVNLGLYYSLIVAALLIVAILHNPDGIFGRIYAALGRRRQRGGGLDQSALSSHGTEAIPVPVGAAPANPVPSSPEKGRSV